MDETLPTLLNGLKLIWTISRHINHCEDDFVAILSAISQEICQKVKEKINIQKIFEELPTHEALKIIQSGKSVLANWQLEFARTRQEIEKQTVHRWEFQT